MKKFLKISFLPLLLLISMTLFLRCDNDSNMPELSGESKQFVLFAKSNPAINGTVTFSKKNDGSTLVTVQLSGTRTGENHPAHIHTSSAAQGGAILVDLNAIDGKTGKSETVIKTLNDGSAITYEQLLALDAYFNVHLSATDLATLIAQGDIGINELTSTSKTYTLSSVTYPAISGTAKLTKRVNGKTLVSISLTGTTQGVSSIAHIHLNTVAQTGGVVVDLTPVNGTTGKSETSVNNLNTGVAISYDELLNFNGYINVHESASAISTLIAQGDIGKNELTTISKTYALNAVTNNAISGTAKFTKRVSGETLISIALTGTTAGVISPAHIHLNSVAQGGGIAIDLTAVNGTTGKSETSVSKLNNGTAITYDMLLDFNGYINVHQSATNLSTIIAQGNIGSNTGNNTALNYNVTNSGASSYIFNGNGLTNSNNPNLTLQRGKTYTFTVNTPGHPFLIKSVQSTGTANPYSDGVTNNGSSNGVITFTIPSNAPNTLYYICEFHSSMTGVITVTN
ncbi:CHRD domain-containing protein [Flavobacterium glaciei]|uniref:Copper/zinc superoxide dismutase (SODC) n=1 Tax=Flavobacterium glaciei TaxID=386300 RepID=A0A562Q6Z3_9FLAO|nr:CHRD domain-containing protein [Flavobacterium glaciei]RDI58163.1 copper/zinc superoxide dismutase (SODC) [Flavobacterium glaciei]TWI51950.1 copper/zinc superoxide dismutase (SODC) [Flavobacterium glaciei]